ncbi:MAG: thioredoxin domain-containing protein [Patescibacteria group bacterium]|nr:thioredoxin domain-containing protein [Patescibacteria group bacterium]
MKSEYVLPITIVVAGAIIAGAVFLVGGGSTPGGGGNTEVTAREYDPATDYILGNPNAPVKVIEYSDLECPFCKEFQKTMNQVMQYYGNSGQVAWVFRHFPLAQLHSKAPQEAAAAECAGELGGNEAFWRYIERIFEITPSSNGLDLAQLPVVAGELGLDVNAFNQCLSPNKYSKKVSDSYAEAIGLGAQGTPFTLVMVGGEAVTLPGNQPYDSMRAAIDAILVGLPAEGAPAQ